MAAPRVVHLKAASCVFRSLAIAAPMSFDRSRDRTRKAAAAWRGSETLSYSQGPKSMTSLDTVDSGAPESEKKCTSAVTGDLNLGAANGLIL